jgi:hypothetical protein
VLDFSFVNDVEEGQVVMTYRVRLVGVYTGAPCPFQVVREIAATKVS